MVFITPTMLVGTRMPRDCRARSAVFYLSKLCLTGSDKSSHALMREWRGNSRVLDFRTWPHGFMLGLFRDHQQPACGRRMCAGQQPAPSRMHEMLLRRKSQRALRQRSSGSLSTANLLFLRFCWTSIMRTGASKRTETQPSPKVPSSLNRHFSAVSKLQDRSVALAAAGISSCTTRV